MENFAIKAKKAIKKVAAISVGAAMVGSTMFGAAAATTLSDYPNPFVEDGLWNTVLVVGEDAAAGDIVGAIDVSARLSQSATSGYTSSETVTSVAGGVSLNSGTNKIYLGSELDDNVDVITKDDFPALLADGTFVDDSGSETDYTQKINPERASFDYSTSTNSLDDPELIIQAGDDASSVTQVFFGYTVTFESTINFTDSTNVQGQPVEMLGKEYTIGTNSDSSTIQLLGGSMDVSLDWGETKTVTFQGEEYELTLDGITSGGTDAAITVNGDSDTISQGNTKSVGGVDVYADTVSYYGLDAYPGKVILSLGADELYIEHQTAVMTGSSKDDIDGTYATVSYTSDFSQVSGFTIYFSADDSDWDHLAEGEEYTDLVFGKIKTTFADVVTGETKTITTNLEGDKELSVTLTDSSGNEETVPFAYDNALGTADSASSDGYDLVVVENATLHDEDYFILSSDSSQHFMQVKKIDIDGDTGVDKVQIKDLFTGTTYTEDAKDMTGAVGDIIIDGVTYSIYGTNGSPDSIKIWQGSTTTVFPYLELWNDKTTRVAWTEDVAIGDTLTAATNNVREYTQYDLPSGTLYISVNDTNVSNTAADGTYEYSTDGSSWTALTAGGAYEDIRVGRVYYQVKTTEDESGNACTLTIDNIAMDPDQASGGTTAETDAALLIIEEEDNKDSNYKHGLLLATEDGSTAAYDEIDADNAVWTYGTDPTLVTFDDTSYKAGYSEFGTYLYEDSSDTYQTFVEVTIPKEQMYANVFIAPTEATTTTSASAGSGVTVNSVSGVETAKLDTEISDKTSKPMILVGGPAVNMLTAEVAGLSYPTYGAEAASVFGFSEGKAVIKMFEDAFGGDNVAIVVAGWEEDDTRRACKVLKDYASYDLSGDHMIVTGTSTTPVVEPFVEEATETTE